MHNHSRTLVIALLCLAAATRALAQDGHVLELTLQDLLEVEVTSAASKFAQETTKAPSSITIVTADEIRRFGYRTLADVLRSVRGVYVTDDRNYTYVGVRGFSRPGDYNGRVLLLVDGHRLNDPVYDQAPIGTDLPIDMEAIDRVEILRGPGSALYGTNAVLAVVNLVTRTGRQQPATRLGAEGGTLETVGGRVSVGHEFDNGTDLFLAASTRATDGVTELYFPEFDSPETLNGIARNADREQFGRLFGKASFGQLTLRGAYGDRTKHVPTGSFGTVFGDTRTRSRDARGFADLSYTGAFGGGWSGVLRGSYDAYRYDGRYPFEYEDESVHLYEDFATADWLTTEWTANRRVQVKHLITAGAEGRYVLRQDQYSRQLGETTIQDQRSSGTWGLYLQDEFSLTSNVVVNAGGRVDHYGTFGLQLTPRAAVIYNPAPRTALKVMHGRAFRAPNGYELYYYANEWHDPTSLQPETIRTNEVVWEQYYGRRLRSTLSVFQSDIDNLISTTTPGEDFLDSSYFANLSRAHSRGVEGELEARLPSGVMARASHAWSHTTDGDTGARLSNSPSQLAKYNLSIPLSPTPFFVALDGSYVSDRLSAAGERVPGFYLQHVTVTGDRILRGIDVSFGVYNLFDRTYGDPGSEEHLQARIPQDGRTVRVKATIRF